MNWMILLASVSFFILNNAYADELSSSQINWSFLIMGLFGGLALFLHGMEEMSKGMKKSAGSQMRYVLSTLTQNQYLGLIVGIVVTTIIQSSSATTVMLVSFVQSGLMGFAQSLGVILGAGIGTTVTAQLIAFKVTNFALLMVAVGFFTYIISKKETVKYIGEAVFGFGLIFFGMKLMSSAMEPLSSYPEFLDLLKGLENPIVGILFGLLFTALIQSSAAFLGIIIIFSQQGLISLEAGIPLVMGTNIGTCITAALASIGTGREAKRVALAHVLFKIIGVFIFIAWIPWFADIVRSFSSMFNSSAARLIANAHTIYNVSLSLFFLPFTKYIGNFIMRIYPDVEDKENDNRIVIRHLDDGLISNPSMAIGLARSEINRMSGTIQRMVSMIIDPICNHKFDFDASDEKYTHLTTLEGIEVRERKVNFLEKSVGKYLLQVCQEELSDEQVNEAFALISIARDLESIGDIISNSIVKQIKKRKNMDVDFSREGLEELEFFHEKICKQISRVRDALKNFNRVKAQKVVKKAEFYIELEEEYKISHLERVRQERRESIETHEVHMEIMDHMKQINVYSGNIAKSISIIAG